MISGAKTWGLFGPIQKKAVKVSISLFCTGAILVSPVLTPLLSSQESQGEKELIAVLPIEAVGAGEVEATAVTERFREELLKSGRFTLVDRSQMEAILNEQAFQQTGCTQEECAVQVGQLLGVHKIVAGKLTRIEAELWLFSVILVDVETAKTERAESVQHEGRINGLLSDGVREVAAKLSTDPGATAPDLRALVQILPNEPVPPHAANETIEEDKGWPWWVWGLLGLGIVAAVASSGGGGEEAAPPSNSSSNPCPAGAGNCNSVPISW